MAVTKRKRGGQTKYSRTMGELICERLANGETPNEIGKDEGMPDESTIRKWALHNEEFAPMYARAREVGYLKMADDLLEIADDGSNDWMTRSTKSGDTYEVFNKEAAERSKLRVDTRKWLLSKALPKVYGDKIEATHEAGDSFRKLWDALGSGALDGLKAGGKAK